jgi:hypothetical protein
VQVSITRSFTSWLIRRPGGSRSDIILAIVAAETERVGKGERGGRRETLATGPRFR